MVVVSFETKRSHEEILNKAVEYFRDKLGLKITERGSCCVYFVDENQIGYVNVTLAEEGNKFKVDIESREYEYQTKEFVRTFK
jgi:hypothetical protein